MAGFGRIDMKLPVFCRLNTALGPLQVRLQTADFTFKSTDFIRGYCYLSLSGLHAPSKPGGLEQR